jgi:hypothetical protein
MFEEEIATVFMKKQYVVNHYPSLRFGGGERTL